MASSKSLASTGSIVMVRVSRKSLRFCISSFDILSGKPSASSKTFCSNSVLNPNSATMACISVLCSPALPNILTTLPYGLGVLSGQSIRSTNTLSPSLALFISSMDTKKSTCTLLLSGMTKANFFIR